MSPERGGDGETNGGVGVNHRNWYAMVEDYTNRDITVASDRLPALVGLAGAMALRFKDKYLAGIW